jgi:hypothetical protein
LSGNLTANAGGAISDSGVLTVVGTSSFTAAGQAIALDNANDFVGTVDARGSLIALRDVNTLDLGAVTAVDSVSVRSGNAINNSGLIKTSRLEVHTTAGSVSVNLGSDPSEGIQLSSHGDLRLRTHGSLTLMPGSLLESKTGSVHIFVAGDLLAYGASLIGRQAALEASGSIKGFAEEKPEPIKFDGALLLQARAGIGGFGFDRVVLQPVASNASLAVRNGSQGDVVIATPDSITISSRGVRSDSDGLVGLLAGIGSIHESGPVFSASGRVVRLTGTTWMSRTDTMAASLVLKTINAEAGLESLASPLEGMNRFLRTGWVSRPEAADGEGRLAAAAELLSAKSSVEMERTAREPAASAAVSAGITGASSVVQALVGISSTHQLLDAAMTLTLQGRNPSLDDTEAITSWVNRVAGDAPSDPPAVEPRSAPDTPAPPDQPPVDSRPTQLRDASDGASESDRGAADPISVFGAAQVKWLVPISALGLWAESPGDAAAGEPEGADPLRT